MTMQGYVALFLLALATLSLTTALLATRALSHRDDDLPDEPHRRRRFGFLVLGVLMLLVVINLCQLSIRRHQLFLTFGYDLAIMDQTVWNTAHGRWLQYSERGELVSRPARGRMELLYLPVALLYRLRPGPETLLVIQAVALVLGAAPLFELARRRSGNSIFAATAGAAYLLHPGLLGTSQHSFHATSLAVPLLLTTWLWIETERYRLAFVGALLTLACREDLGVVIAPIGVYLAVVRRQRLFGGGLAVIGVAWIVGTMALLPRLSGVNAGVSEPTLNPMFGRLALGALGMVKFYLKHPLEIPTSLFTHHNAFFLATLLGPLAFLPLLAPRALAVVLPTLLFYLLSGWIEMTQVDKHYTANLLPTLAGATVLGAEAVRRLGNRRVWWAMSIHLVLMTAVFAWLPETRFRWTQGAYWSPPHQSALEAAVQRIPAEAAVIASQHLAPHVAGRQRLDMWETGAFASADTALFDGLGPLLWRGWFAPENPTEPARLVPYPLELLRDERWRVDWSRDCVTVLRRDSPDATARRQSLLELFRPLPLEPLDSPIGLIGFGVATRHSAFGRIYRLRMNWRGDSARSNIALVLRDGERRFALAHQPAHGLLSGRERPFGEELIVHLPLSVAPHWQFGIGELSAPAEAGALVAAGGLRRVHWLNVTVSEGAS